MLFGSNDDAVAVGDVGKGIVLLEVLRATLPVDSVWDSTVDRVSNAGRFGKRMS